MFHIKKKKKKIKLVVREKVGKLGFVQQVMGSKMQGSINQSIKSIDRSDNFFFFQKEKIQTGTRKLQATLKQVSGIPFEEDDSGHLFSFGI